VGLSLPFSLTRRTYNTPSYVMRVCDECTRLQPVILAADFVQPNKHYSNYLEGKRIIMPNYYADLFGLVLAMIDLLSLAVKRALIT